MIKKQFSNPEKGYYIRCDSKTHICCMSLPLFWAKMGLNIQPNKRFFPSDYK